MSALILSRLLSTINSALEYEVPITEMFGWTDSKVTMYWIRGVDKEWKQFVQRRVQEIRRLVPEMHWEHCPGEANPADIPSRGASPAELARSTLWKDGPSWLATFNPETRVSEVNEQGPPPKECTVEMLSKERKKFADCISLHTSTKSTEMGEIVDYKQFSNFQRLLRVTALVLRFIDILKNRGEKTSGITASDVKRAEVLWIKEIQRSLVSNKNFENWKREFAIFIDDQGVMRCGGRITNSEAPYSAKHPILLDASHRLTELIILDSHRRVMHNGMKDTLTDLRGRYWLVRGRQTVKRILHKCVVCRKHEGKPYQAPPSPPLPEFRVKIEPAFTFTGLDYAGPVYIQEIARSESKKLWICLYTCCVTRAVHLEIVPNLTAEAFLRNVRRFIARRGSPIKVVSDILLSRLQQVR